MSAADLRSIILTVADRFSFPANDYFKMKISRLLWWYYGAVELYETDKGAVDGKT